MEKPKSPKKPSKSDKAPSKEISVYRLICEGDHGIGLLPDPTSIDFVPEENLVQYCIDQEIDLSELSIYDYIKFYDVDLVYRNLKFSTLLDLHKIVGKDFTIDCYYEYESRSGYYGIVYSEENPNYEAELDVYNNRFDNYQLELARFYAATELYSIYIKNKKADKLKAELKKLEG